MATRPSLHACCQALEPDEKASSCPCTLPEATWSAAIFSVLQRMGGYRRVAAALELQYLPPRRGRCSSVPWSTESTGRDLALVQFSQAKAPARSMSRSDGSTAGEHNVRGQPEQNRCIPSCKTETAVRQAIVRIGCWQERYQQQDSLQKAA